MDNEGLRYDIVISSYDTVVRDGALFDMVNWKVVVLDEAQVIKNPETRRALAVKALKIRLNRVMLRFQITCCKVATSAQIIPVLIIPTTTIIIKPLATAWVVE